MNGMHYQYGWASTTGSDDYTASWHYELPPTPTIGELSLGDYFEFDDKAHVDLGFTHVEYLGPQGQTSHNDYPDIDSFDVQHDVSITNMTRADWAMRVSNCTASFLLNLFFWDSVY